MRHLLFVSAAALMLAGCPTADQGTDVPETMTTTQSFDGAKLDAVLATQSDKAKARYDARNPKATLEFFGITPGMAVGEALPGGGWYSKILVPYLGTDGQLIGIDYAYKMWPEFSFANEEFMATKKTWAVDWVAKSMEWAPADGARISATTFDADDQPQATLDAMLFIRALHNFSRFEDEGNYMTDALTETYAMLKPGGIVGVVQHAGPESADGEWADGSAGYLKQSNVVAAFEAAGFEFVGETDINANSKDKPTSEDIVWRLPPSLRGDESTKDVRTAIGESNRMTLKFRKPV